MKKFDVISIDQFTTKAINYGLHDIFFNSLIYIKVGS